MIHKICKILLWVVLTPVILVVLIISLLYLPPIQDRVADFATEKVNHSTGMKISVGKFRLLFPARIRLSDVSVLLAQGDTMVTAANARLDVSILPLLRSRVEVSDIRLEKAYYQLGNADSVMWLRANMNSGDITSVSIALPTQEISLDNADISGVKVNLRILEDTAAVKTDSVTPSKMLIRANNIVLSDLDYSMQMMPMIDSIGCHIDTATLRDAMVDMGARSIKGRSLTIDSVSAAYIYPEVTSVSKSPSAAEPTVTTDNWTITADTLRLTARDALYAQSGVSPLPGFDPTYICASGVSIEVDSFYNCGTSITVPLKKFEATERCGLPLRASGTFSMDGSLMRADGFSFSTLRSQLNLDASMGIGDMLNDMDLPIALKGSGVIAPADVALAFPDMATMLSLPGLLSLSTDIEGTTGELNIYDLALSMPSFFRVKGNGSVEYPFNPQKIGGGITLDGQLASLSDKEFSFLPLRHTPALTLHSDINYSPGEAEGSIIVTTSGGRLAADGSWVAKDEDYNASLVLDNFPVALFMPDLGVGHITARANIDGRGYNPLKKNTSVDADVNLLKADYMKAVYSDIRLKASLHAGQASGEIVSRNPGADASLNFIASIVADSIHYTLDGDLRDINLLTLHLADTLCHGHLTLLSSGYYNTANNDMDITASVDRLYWQLPGIDIKPAGPISLASESSPTGSSSKLSNGDLAIFLTTQKPLMEVFNTLPQVTSELTRQLDSMKFNVSALENVLPQFSLHAGMGRRNVLTDFIASSGIDIDSLSATIMNDSLIYLNACALGVTTGSTRIDTLRLDAVQHGEYLVYDLNMDNRPGTWDDFAHVTLNGFAGSNRLSAFLKQQNIRGERGFTLGLGASVADSIVTVKFTPYTPVIAYKPWTLNKDNFLSYDLSNKHLDANLELTGDNSFLRIYTAHEGGDGKTELTVDSVGGHYHGAQEDLIVQISNIRLKDWLAINPFAPPVKGDVSADLKFRYEDPQITGRGSVSLSDFYYGKERVGDFDLDIDIANSPGGKVVADVALMVDSVRTITAKGVVNDSTLASPFLLDFNMIRFPLSVVNPFLPMGTARLSGVLNGSMKITGDMAHPVFDGHLDFDSTKVKVTMLGTEFAFSESRIPVDSNVVTFKGFDITACNANPLVINGTVDARHISDIRLDLDLAARNMQIVNSSRARGGADVYGKAFLDLFAAVKGNMSRLNVTADVSLLSGTNVTYVIPEVEQTLTGASDNDMVTFVQFSDTASMQKADSIAAPAMMLIANADLHLQEGATINVDLSSGGSNKIQVKPSGDLDYSMSPLNGQRLTGRLNINSGFVRYTPPLMSEKNFTFSEGSYIAFNGNIMNPVLNIHATDVVRANVTQDGQNSRVVDFDVRLSITNTFDNMNVAFDLSTNDDITVQNELSSMSAEQRANQAMNLLLYNVYTGAGTKGTSVAGNPLYSFLTSQLNSWAASNIKGVDISFGIDQYDRTYEGNTSTATSYSYRVSKTLFNDRFKIVVGGNYSTDADSDENFSQNLINDISFEYLLNASGSMYVRIFRHTGYESILEGEITQTGVGFVLKRKMNALRELLGIKRD